MLSRVPANVQAFRHHSRQTRLLFLLGMWLLASVGAAFPFQVFYGLDISLVSIATLMVLRVLDKSLALQIAVGAGIISVLAGQSPFDAALWCLELLCVGLINNRSQRNLVLADATFWLLIGLPVSLIIGLWVNESASQMTLLRALGHVVNGVSNAVLVEMFTAFFGMKGWSPGGSYLEPITLQRLLFSLLTAFVLFPAFLPLIVTGRFEMHNLNRMMSTRLAAGFEQVQDAIELWKEEHVQTLVELAAYGDGEPVRSQQRLQQRIDSVARVMADYQALAVIDADGSVLAETHLPGVELTKVRTWTQVCDQSQDNGTGASGTRVHAQDRSEPVLLLCVSGTAVQPARRRVVALVSFSGLADFLNRWRKAGEGSVFAPHVTVLDLSGISLVQTTGATEAQPGSDWHRHAVAPGLFQAEPGSSRMHAPVNWPKTIYVLQRQTDATIPFVVQLSLPLAPVLTSLYGIYSSVLIIMLLLALVAMGAAALASRLVAAPILALRDTSTDLPAKLLANEQITWPHSHISEVSSLVANFRSMMTSLRQAVAHLQQSNRELRSLAELDHLTGLLNRRQCLLELDRAIVQARATDGHIAVLFLDLDGLKMVNDQLGHDVGDELLKAVAGRIRRCLRADTIAARLGGDEFVVVLPDITHPGDATAVADRIRHAVAGTFELAGHRVQITISIGIALYPEHGDHSDALLKHADADMYMAKRLRHGSQQAP